jgi:hypothetical protein
MQLERWVPPQFSRLILQLEHQGGLEYKIQLLGFLKHMLSATLFEIKGLHCRMRLPVQAIALCYRTLKIARMATLYNHHLNDQILLHHHWHGTFPHLVVFLQIHQRYMTIVHGLGG